MNRLKTLFAIVFVTAALALLAPIALADTARPDSIDVNLSYQSPPASVSLWSGAFFFDLKNSTMDAVVMNDVFSLTRNGRPTGFIASLFVGATVNTANKGVAGAAIGFKWQLFDQVSAYLGGALSLSSGVPIGGGPVAGINIGIGAKPSTTNSFVTTISGKPPQWAFMRSLAAGVRF